MPPRPTHINLSDAASEYDDQQHQRPPRPPFYMDLPSPRTGEAPPALSPLDAFALQSRMLAKKFEAAEDGRRISRLPHRDVAKEFGNRQGYFGGFNDMGMNDVPESKDETSSPAGTQVSEPDAKNRPMSHYPLFGNAHQSSLPDHGLGTPFDEAEEDEELENEAKQERDYFGFSAPRAASPEPFDNKVVNVAPPTPNMPSLTSSVDSVQSSSHPPPRTLTNGSTRSYRSLAPPRSPAFPKSPRSFQSIRSVRQDSGDDDVSTSGSQPVSSSRKFSGSSNMSRPQSPMSPWMQPVQRSPSMTSEFSMNGSQQAVRPMNFSRPMSSASNRPPNIDSRPSLDARPSMESRSSFETRPSMDLPLRNFPSASSVIQTSVMPSRDISDDSLASPFPPMSDTDTLDAERSGTAPYSSYTYAKFTLPRGRNPERQSNGLRQSWIERQFNWDNPADEPSAAVPPGPATDDPSIPAHVFAGNSDDLHDLVATRPPSAGSARLPQEHTERVGRQRAMSSANRSRSAGPRPFSFERPNTISAEPPLPRSSPSVRTHATDSTDRTIKGARSNNNNSHHHHHQQSSTSTPKPSSHHLHARSPSELTPEGHLEIGIAAHSRGELNKSTYHLRLAAKAGLPTAMLLYALACRHGWGMRPNQADGVMWLRKAIETAGLEVTTGVDVEAMAFGGLGDLSSTSASSNAKKTTATTDSSDTSTTNRPSTSSHPADPAAEAFERRKRKAQFALAIYELGISYMNGWGCPKDKALAVRCYEVAGSWGDCDALAEAGFCYTQGLGVKKDLKKAAAFYRKAAEGGMSMAGNSWIYKPKYMDDSSTSKSPEKDKDKEKSGGTANGGGGAVAGNDSAATAGANGAKTQTRARARSIWGRNKKEK